MHTSVLIIVILGVIDYFVYNLVYKNAKALITYRILQNLSWMVISYVTGVVMHNPIYAIQFLLLYFGWVGDWIYYFMCEITNGFNLHWLPGRGAIEEVFSDHVVWAWWTFVGLVTRLIPGKKDVPIKGTVLIVQSLVCILIAIAIGLL